MGQDDDTLTREQTQTKLRLSDNAQTMRKPSQSSLSHSKLKGDAPPDSFVQVQEAFKETMTIISSLKEEVDLLAEQTKARFDNQAKTTLQERDLILKRVLLEIEPLKADTSFLRDRDSAIT